MMAQHFSMTLSGSLSTCLEAQIKSVDSVEMPAATASSHVNKYMLPFMESTERGTVICKLTL